jgi:putative flavoprotein involved in K+ transport
VRKLFGEEIAERVGPIWGFGDEQELRNMFVRTAQPGLYFIAGSFAQCRIYSKYLALQIKAAELGLIPSFRSATCPSPASRHTPLGTLSPQSGERAGPSAARAG